MVKMAMTAKNPLSFSASLTLLHLMDAVLKSKEIRNIGITSRAQLLTCLTKAIERRYEKLPADMKKKGKDVGPGSSGITLTRTDVIDTLDKVVTSSAGVDLALYSSQNLVIAGLRHLLQDVSIPERDAKAIVEITVADIKAEYKRLYGAADQNNNGSNDSAAAPK